MSPANSLDGAIVSIINRKSGTAVDLKLAGGSKNDTPIFGYRFHGGKNQQWKLKMVDNGSPWPVWMLKNVKFGTYMDLFGSGTANGTKVVGWSGGTTTNQNQLWRLITADPNCQLFMLQNVGSNTYLDLAGGKSDPRTPIQGWKGQVDFSNRNQQWTLVRMDQGH